MGHGVNCIWTYGLHYNYGFSVYGKQFNTRRAAAVSALDELKTMLKKNHQHRYDKQPVIQATLRTIAKEQNGFIQLSLF